MAEFENSETEYSPETEWQQKLWGVHLDKKIMNELIMNFFVTEGYYDAARSFSNEAGASFNADVEFLISRDAIRKDIIRGEVDAAIDKVNVVVPELLERNKELMFYLRQQQSVDLIKNDKIADALSHIETYLVPLLSISHGLQEEFENTVALLAFKEEANCGCSYLLNSSLLYKHASMLNAAITKSREAQDSQLMTLLKLLAWSQQQLKRHIKITDLELS